MLNFQRWQGIVWKGNLFSLFVWFCCLEVKTFPQFGKRKYSYHSHHGRGAQVNISWSFHKGELWTYIRFSVKRIPTFFFRQIHSCLDCFVHLVETTIPPFSFDLLFGLRRLKASQAKDSRSMAFRWSGTQTIRILYLCTRRPSVFCILY